MLRIPTALAALLLAGTAQAAPVTVDNCGEPLTFETTPKRMVTQDINISEMAFALGLQDHMVGVSGISAAFHLQKYGGNAVDVTLVEAAESIGGHALPIATPEHGTVDLGFM